jgi:hypothetical protein
VSIVIKEDVTAGDGAKRVEAILLRASVNKKGEIQDEAAPYSMSDAEQQVSSLILKHFILGTTNTYTPRVEFNDLSLVGRDMYDQMSFNTYQPNNGEAWEGNPQQAWRSRAIRPIVRNKCMSIAAHATARLIFPKVFAYDNDSDEQKDAAEVMEDLMEWSGDVSNYPYVALMRVITAMASPASIGYTEYGEVMRTVKTEKDDDGKWIEKRVRDEAYPCFMDCVVPVDQIYIENFYEPDIQKQGFIIWRKVYSYSAAQGKYNGVYDNFKYVRPGVQTIYDDANRTFYYVYDPNMRMEDVEEIVYWNRNLDLKIIMVNGVMLTECDNPNPRKDKLYPFDKFGYEPINNRFFWYKSLAFKLQHDAEIVNTLYQMVIDGTYLSIFKPMVSVGGEIIASDVIVPGAVTSLSDPNADLRAINVGSDLKSGLETLGVVEKSINESSQEPIQGGAAAPAGTTAYEISRIEQNANTVLGLFLQMIAKHVKDFGKLRMGDILQYLTVPEVAEITGDPELVYKTFFMKGATKGAGKNRKIQFSKDMPDEMTDDEHLQASYEVLKQEKKKDMQISVVNPGMFRGFQYMATISPDVMNPRSSDLERAYDLEAYDRMVQNPTADPEETLKLLLGSNPTTMKDPDKYIAKQPQQQPQMPPQMQPGQQNGQMPASGNSPLASAMGNLQSQSPAPLAGLSK